MPFANTEAIQLHIEEIARHVAEGAHAMLLLDLSGWLTTGALMWLDNIGSGLISKRDASLPNRGRTLGAAR